MGVTIQDADAVRAYLARIGVQHVPATDVDGLVTLHRAHRLTIPFENLDIPLGRGIDIAPDAIVAKLVGRRRGGYCFEQNGLFLDRLCDLGFVARPLLARVWLAVPPGEVPPRTHMLVLVTLDGRDWIADVGFGGSLTPPLPLEDGVEATTPDGARHRLRRGAVPGDPDGQWLLERQGPAGATDGRSPGSGWQPQYGFAERVVTGSDIAQCNHWTATRPGTRFTSFCVASRVLPDGFAGLMDRALNIYRAGGPETRLIDGSEEYRAVLAELFGIDLTVEEVLALPIFARASV
ncbi:arylamine N-acetyltransferase [Sphingobium sufflavum]|uniref:arylamine N-acetyltransferase family protein n=1 Tax=Sphingobium sufflavum TaxID=1129547 RepID=UPI001F3121AB|nr:arylamine N-acetyltransferase [Sphingobium sufflavum]MCE7795919.1 arylamine N-acetyltransferase [Sphingobium sufflavum]